SGSLTFEQEPLNLIGPDRSLLINSILHIAHEVGMTELMSTRRGLVLGTPAIMDEHSLIALGKMLLNRSISAPAINHKVRGLRRLPHPFPPPFSCDPRARFIGADPWSLHDFVLDYLDDSFGLAEHECQFVGNGPLRDAKPKHIMGDLAEPPIGKGMFNIEIGDQ